MALRTATVPALAAIPGLVHGFERRAPGDGEETGEERLLGIKTADCLPVLLVDPKRRLVAAAHAGWRGTAAFPPSGAAFFRPGPNGRPHLDVRAASARQLVEAGLRPEALHHVADCTRCRADLYHSYRRDGQRAGRMISFVGFTAS